MVPSLSLGWLAALALVAAPAPMPDAGVADAGALASAFPDAGLVDAGVAGFQPSHAPVAPTPFPDSELITWLRSRAEANDAYLKAEAPGHGAAEGLWRERPAQLPVPGFTAPSSLAPLIRAVRPGVVNVSTTNVPAAAAAGQPAPEPGHSLGSGFLLSPDGYVVTNHHVIANAQQVTVKLADGRQFAAEVVGKDPSTDVALLRLVGAERDLPFVYLGDSDRLEVGDWVMAIGNPFGLDYSVVQGIISAKERVLGVGDFDDFLQTDALINPGNSGGPLFNMRGEVVGVNTAIVSQGQGIGFAVPINMVKDLLPNLRENGRLARGWLGLTVLEESAIVPKGAVVKDVYANSPAAGAGLLPGDRIIAVGTRAIESYLQLLRRVALLPPGATVRLTVVRGGAASHEVLVKLGERPAQETLQPVPGPGFQGPLGLVLEELPRERADALGLEPFSGVRVSGLVRNGAAARAGLREGDVITEVNRHPVGDLNSFEAALDAGAGAATLIQYQRGQQTRYVAIEP